MGCHTWVRVPFLKGKKDILKLAQETLNSFDSLSASETKWYQLAINNELVDPVCEMIGKGCNYNEEWLVYQDVEDWSLENEFNPKHGTSHTSRYDIPPDQRKELETYSDEPRIGGYPERIIHSYEEMVDFMKTGFDAMEDGQSRHYDFHYEEDRYEMFMAGFRNLVIKHPDGIITFG